MAWSNNAEPIYAFRLNRVEPFYVPFISSFAGPFRYEFFFGSLKGHDTPNAPWVHVEKFSFKPHPDLEFRLCAHRYLGAARACAYHRAYLSAWLLQPQWSSG